MIEKNKTIDSENQINSSSTNDINSQVSPDTSSQEPYSQYAKIQQDLDNFEKFHDKEFPETIEEQKKDLSIQKDRIDKLEKNYKEKIEESQKKIIETMGVFVALFTFISISTNILLKFQNIYSALFFLSTFAFILTVFLFVFHFILSIKEGESVLKNFAWAISIPALVAIIFGIILFCQKEKNNASVDDKDKQVIYQTNDIKMDTIISTNTVTVSTGIFSKK